MRCASLSETSDSAWIGSPGPACLGKQSSEVLDLSSQFSASITSVDDRAGLEQEHRCFGIGARTVLHAVGDDEQFPRREDHIAVSHLNSEPSVEDQEELVGVGVPVPGPPEGHVCVTPTRLPNSEAGRRTAQEYTHGGFPGQGTS
jgi:hypothetical protein